MQTVGRLLPHPILVSPVEPSTPARCGEPFVLTTMTELCSRHCKSRDLNTLASDAEEAPPLSKLSDLGGARGLLYASFCVKSGYIRPNAFGIYMNIAPPPFFLPRMLSQYPKSVQNIRCLLRLFYHPLPYLGYRYCFLNHVSTRLLLLDHRDCAQAACESWHQQCL